MVFSLSPVTSCIPSRRAACSASPCRACGLHYSAALASPAPPLASLTPARLPRPTRPPPSQRAQPRADLASPAQTRPRDISARTRSCSDRVCLSPWLPFAAHCAAAPQSGETCPAPQKGSSLAARSTRSTSDTHPQRMQDCP